MMQVVLTILLLFYFFLAALIDVRQGELSLWFLLAGFLSGLTLQLLFCRCPVSELVLSWIPGGILFLISGLSRQAIGFGDSALLLGAGCFLLLPRTLLLLVLSFLAAGGTSVLLVVLKKKKRSDDLPFAPFYLAGYVILLAVSGL